jgi:outer membrane receptor for ferrienterochelin and colicins
MERVEVKAKAAEKLLGDAPTATQVVTSRDIEDKGADNLQEALAGETGVRVATCCPTSNAAEVQLQGLPGKYTEVAMDGLPGLTELGCCYGLAHVPAEDIERIEITKGPGTLQYGGDAFGGVINVVTKSLAKTSGSVTVEGGNFGTLGLKGTVGAKFEQLDITAILSKNRTGASDINADSISDYAESDRTSFSLKLRQTLRPGLMLTVNGFSWTDERHGGSLARIAGRSAEGAYENPNLLNWGPAVALNWQPTGSTVLAARGAYSNYRQRVFTDESWRTAYEDVAYGDLQYVGLLPLEQKLTATVSHRYERLIENTRLDGKTTTMSALVLEDEITLGPATLAARGRLERHSEFGLLAMPGASVLVRPLAALTLRASYGMGYKAPPAFSKLVSFCPDQGLFEVIQNPDLRPERSLGGNLSAEYRLADLSLSASLFRNDIDGMIADSLVSRDTVTGVWRYQHYNRGAVVTQGAELGAAVRFLRAFSLRAGYSLLDARDVSAAGVLPYRPAHSANLTLAWESRRLGLDASLGGEFTGSMVTQRRDGDRLVPDEPSPAFTTWNLRATKQFGPHYAVFLSANNILGFVQSDWLEEDVPLWGPNRGRHVVAGVKLSI